MIEYVDTPIKRSEERSAFDEFHDSRVFNRFVDCESYYNNLKENLNLLPHEGMLDVWLKACAYRSHKDSTHQRISLMCDTGMYDWTVF